MSVRKDKKNKWQVEFGNRRSIENPRYNTSFAESIHGKYAEKMAYFVHDNKIREPLCNWFEYKDTYVIIFCYLKSLDKYFEIKVDIDDYENKLKFKHWGAYENTTNPGQYYFRTKTKNDTDNAAIKLHRYIMGITDPLIKVDHINGDTLDNRKCNLRVVNSEINGKNRSKKPQRNNTSGQNGVKWSSYHNVWITQWTENKKLKTKTFNPKKYNGDRDAAFNAAKEFRIQKEKEFYYNDNRNDTEE